MRVFCASSHWFGKGTGGGVGSANQDGAPELCSLMARARQRAS